jgi:hypothetical protein
VRQPKKEKAIRPTESGVSRRTPSIFCDRQEQKNAASEGNGTLASLINFSCVTHACPFAAE